MNTACVRLLQAGHSRDEALLEKVTNTWQLAIIQANVLKEVNKRLDIEARRGGATDALTNCAAQLQRESLTSTVLFNDFAVVRFLPCPPTVLFVGEL